MTHHFRPRIESLEARDVPAAFSAVLPSGAVVSGSFSTPEGVDPAQSSQSLALTDLAVTKGGVAYTTQPGATAQYQYGALVGVLAAASGPDTIQITNGTLQVSLQSAPVVYDAADTRMTFALSDGAAGAISYAIPWDQVDPEQASQSLTPSALNLNIRGHNFAAGAAGYTTAPTLVFAYGDLQGVNFTLDLTNSGLPYLSLSVGKDLLTGEWRAQAETAPNQFLAAPVQQKGPASITLDFSAVTIPATGSVKYTLVVATGGGASEKTVTVEVFAGATQSDVRDLFQTALEGFGFSAKATGTTKLNIGGTATSELWRIQAKDFGTNDKNPKMIGRTQDGAGGFPAYVINP